MQQRALEIGGTLKISPAEDGSGMPGTEVTLWVPCPAQRQVTDRTAASEAPADQTPKAEKPDAENAVAERVP
jgi:hypothetical protein